jgi:hypothetical protein
MPCVVLILLLLAACGPPDEVDEADNGGSGVAPTESNPLRNAYFGDLHVHTRFSFDAFIFNVRATPDDAYRYARGEAIGHAGGFDVQLESGPLDFLAVTDHASTWASCRRCPTPPASSMGSTSPRRCVARPG